MMLFVSVGTKAEDWMGRLPDNLFVCQLSIPGSHDAATGSGFLLASLGSRYAQTQDITIAEQWSLGVRAFDLRPCTYNGYLNINHGIMPTKVHFDDALYLLRDSLIAHPTEFVVIHMLHESDGDQVENAYESMLLELLNSDGLKDFFVDFRSDLTVEEMRGKILLLSRDKYATKPIGGFFSNWCGWVDWNVQTQGKITGAGTGASATAPLYMQDFADTHNEGGVALKVGAVKTMLDFSTTHSTTGASDAVWVFNFASAYSQITNLLGNEISLSDGYRDNATYTNAAIIDYLETHEAGPTGVIIADYVGVDKSGNYATQGKKLVEVLIENNFKYVDRINLAAYEKAMASINLLYGNLEDAQERIANECPDVASDYAGQLAEVKDSIDNLKAHTDELYAARLLTETYSITTTGLSRTMRRIVSAAVEAQTAIYEQVNQEVYGNAMIVIDSLYSALDDARERIAVECADVAADYEGELTMVEDTINQLKSETDELYPRLYLTPSYTIETDDIVSDIDRIVAEALAAQEQYAKQVEEAYEKAMADIVSLSSALGDAQERIANECPDVASDYAGELAAVEETIGRLKSEAEDLYADHLLTPSYSVGAEDIAATIEQVITDALAAQLQYELEMGIHVVAREGSDMDYQIYSVTGERLDAFRRGAVNIVRYADGRVRKVLIQR